MENIRNLMAEKHRQCDDCFVAVEQAVAREAWADASAAFEHFKDATLQHFAIEETILFPAFEAHTGMRMGPTPVSYTHLDVYKRQSVSSTRASCSR